ncbi:MAG: tetratricopeptide repeat protein [Oscillospiraceae bacterium]|nr:tetratricopeptide repeat protein [Oscillospiraceae bacterium]
MSTEEMVQEKAKTPHFFDRLWPKRTVALVLGLSMIVALLVPAAFRTDRQETETEEPQRIAAQEEAAEQSEPQETTAFHDAFLTAYELCALAQSQGDYDAALEQAEECLRLAQTKEERVTALAQKGDALFALERYAEAGETYREILEADAADLVSLYVLNSKLARCQLLEGELEDALMSCNLALEQAESDAQRAEILAVRGVVLYGGGAFAEAKTDFEDALAAGYENPELLQTQIEQCEQQLAAEAGGEQAFAAPGQPTSAAQAQTTMPEPTEREKNAAVYYFSGKYAEAAAEFRKLLGKSYYYSDMQLYSNIAKCEYLLGNYPAAVENCTSGLQQKGDEERAALYTLRASAYMTLGESALAAPDFEAAIAYGASDPKLNALQAAICYYFSEDYEKCIALGEPLIDEPGYEEATLWVGFARYMRGELDMAAELLGRSVDLEQSYSRKDELYRIKARCEFQLGRFEQTIASADSGLAAAAELGEENSLITAELHYLRGAACLSIGQYEAARSDLNAALELGAENEYEVLAQLTLCEFLLADYENAARHGEQAMDLGGPTSDLCYWVGLSQFSIEQYEKARSTLQFCQELEPTKENIWFYIGVCSFSMEDYETAIGQFTASIEADEPAADRSRYNRAICYLQREAYEKAKEDLETAANGTSEDVAADAKALLDNLKAVLG